MSLVFHSYRNIPHIASLLLNVAIVFLNTSSEARPRVTGVLSVRYVRVRAPACVVIKISAVNLIIRAGVHTLTCGEKFIVSRSCEHLSTNEHCEISVIESVSGGSRYVACSSRRASPPPRPPLSLLQRGGIHTDTQASCDRPNDRQFKTGRSHKERHYFTLRMPHIYATFFCSELCYQMKTHHVS